MPALQSGQHNDDIIEIYEDLLRSYITPLPVRDNYSDHEIRQMCRNSKIRLQKILLIFDVVISQRDLELVTIQHFHEDFLHNILRIVRDVPGTYFNDKTIVSKKLLLSKKLFSTSIDARKSILGKTTVKQIRANNAKFYNSLTYCVSLFEIALADWEMHLPTQSQGRFRPDGDLLERLDTKKQRLKEIYNDLYDIAFDVIEDTEIEIYEIDIREIIETLSDILDKDEHIGMYIRAKRETIKCLREARTQLNLALDEYILLDEGRVDRQTLYDRLNGCIECLDQAQNFWFKRQ